MLKHQLSLRSACVRPRMLPCRQIATTCLSGAEAATYVQHIDDEALISPKELQDLPFYCQFPLDRRADLRRNNEELAKLWALPTARIVPVLKDKVLVRRNNQEGDGSSPTPRHSSLQPAYLEPAASALASGHIAAGSPTVFLGVDPRQGTPYFAAEVGDGCAIRSDAVTRNSRQGVW